MGFFIRNCKTGHAFWRPLYLTEAASGEAKGNFLGGLGHESAHTTIPVALARRSQIAATIGKVEMKPNDSDHAPVQVSERFDVATTGGQ